MYSKRGSYKHTLTGSSILGFSQITPLSCWCNLYFVYIDVPTVIVANHFYIFPFNLTKIQVFYEQIPITTLDLYSSHIFTTLTISLYAFTHILYKIFLNSLRINCEKQKVIKITKKLFQFKVDTIKKHFLYVSRIHCSIISILTIFNVLFYIFLFKKIISHHYIYFIR